jgi:hypothetical protein
MRRRLAGIGAGYQRNSALHEALIPLKQLCAEPGIPLTIAIVQLVTNPGNVRFEREKSRSQLSPDRTESACATDIQRAHSISAYDIADQQSVAMAALKPELQLLNTSNTEFVTRCPWSVPFPKSHNATNNDLWKMVVVGYVGDMFWPLRFKQVFLLPRQLCFIPRYSRSSHHEQSVHSRHVVC